MGCQSGPLIKESAGRFPGLFSWFGKGVERPLKLKSMIRNCDYCGKEYKADPRNLKRGWGLCCSKSCAAHKREKSKPGYNSERVKRNNVRRENWNENYPNRGYRRTSEGYKVIDGVAYNEYGEPMYDIGIAGEYDPADDEYWNSKDFD